MLWVMLMPTGDFKFVELIGNLNLTKYIRILKDNILHTTKSLYNNDLLLQHGNVSSHTSKKTQQFLENKGITLLSLPSKILDHNGKLLHNIFASMDRLIILQI